MISSDFDNSQAGQKTNPGWFCFSHHFWNGTCCKNLNYVCLSTSFGNMTRKHDKMIQHVWFAVPKIVKIIMRVFALLFPLSHFRFILRYGSQRGCQAEPEMHMFLVKTTFYRGPPSKQFFLTFFLWFCATRVSHQAAAALYLPLLHTTRIQKISISTCFGGLQALLSACFFSKFFL